MQAEPRCIEASEHRVEPQRDLGQLDCRRIQVHPVYLMQGKVGLHLLQLHLVAVGIDDLAVILLLTLEVFRSKLPDCLDREGA